MKFYRCNICGNILIVADDSGVNPDCCNQKMELLKENTTDGIFEKHIPVIEKVDDRIIAKVGEIEHPMLDDHYIQMIVLETDSGYHLQYLIPRSKPRAEFLISPDEKVIAAYEYCNLHSLFKKEIDHEEE